MFIMRKDLFFEYCEFLFGVLSKIEAETDFETYTTNGKRTLGYIAEIILAAYIWQKEAQGLKIQKLGITEVEFPYEKETIDQILKKGCPSLCKYINIKLKSIFLKGEQKQAAKETYQSLRRQIKSYKKLKNIYKNTIL